MQGQEINKYLNRNPLFSGIWENIIHHEEDDLPEETKKLMVEYLHPKLKKLFSSVEFQLVCLLCQRAQNLQNPPTFQPMGISADPIVPQFSVSSTPDGF